jgi:hypothetical protein
MKQVGKIYSAVDADELEVGDIVISANNLISLKNYELTGLSELLRMIRGKEFANRFETSFGSALWYNFAKLICPKKHAKVFKAFQNGAKVERNEHAFDRINNKIKLVDFWVLDNNPSWAEGVEFRIAEPVHDNAELPEGLHWENSLIDDESETKYVLAWSFKENKRIEVLEEKTERFTNRELAMWLAKGNGEVKSPYYLTRCHFDYHGYAEKEIVASDILIRTWDDEEWHEPIKVKE